MEVGYFEGGVYFREAEGAEGKELKCFRFVNCIGAVFMHCKG